MLLTAPARPLLLGLAWGLIVSAGCAPVHGANRNFLRGSRNTSVKLKHVPVRGHTVEVTLKNKHILKGELYAVDAEYIWLRIDRRAVTPRGIPIDAVRGVNILLYSSGAGAFVAWQLLGTAIAFSNGLAAVFTVPAWLGGGIPAAIAPFRNDDIDLGTRVIRSKLYQFARFPQGLPPKLRASWAPD